MNEQSFSYERFRSPAPEVIEELYRNKSIRLPLDPSEFVMFVDRRPQESGAEQSDLPELRTLPYHHRSADYGVDFEMRQEIPRSGKRVEPIVNYFYHIDLKGAGFFYPEGYESKKDKIAKGSFAGAQEVALAPDSVEMEFRYNVLGLLDHRVAMTDLQTLKRVEPAGMRTEAIAGIYYLPHVRMGGKEYSIAELKNKLIIQFDAEIAKAKAAGNRQRVAELHAKQKDVLDNYAPVEMVRLLRSTFRLRDYIDGNPANRAAMRKEVQSNLNLEMKALGREDRFELESPEGRGRWMEFLSYWSGKNMGILHREGMIHLFMHMGNITLAGEVVDLDSVQTVVSRKRIAGASAEPFFRRSSTDSGVAYVNPAINMLRQPDERFGLPKCVIKDIRDACFSFRGVLRNLPEDFHGIDRQRLAAKMIEGYREGLGDAEPFQSIGIPRSRLEEVVTEVANEVMGKGFYYAPIPLDVVSP